MTIKLEYAPLTLFFALVVIVPEALEKISISTTERILVAMSHMYLVFHRLVDITLPEIWIWNDTKNIFTH